MFFKQKRFRKIPTAIEALQNEFYIGIESSKLNEKDLLNIVNSYRFCRHLLVR